MEAFPPSIILAAYAEALVDGRRVVVFGDATSDVAAELVERGARNVHVFDREPSRTALAAGQNRSKQISIASHDDVDLAVRDGAFDVALVEDLSTFDDPVSLLKLVRRALSSRGAAIVASPNVEAKQSLLPRTSAGGGSSALGYYELYDAVSAEFAEVRMLGQTPFVGYAVVDFAPDDEPEVSIDSSLLPSGAEEPEWFVALAARERLDCDPVGIVQLPAHLVAGGGVSSEVSDQLRLSRATEERLLERVAELEAEATGLRKERTEAETRLRDELSSLRQSVAGGDAARLQLQELAADATRAELEKTELRDKLGKLSAEAGELAEQRARLEGENGRLAGVVDELGARAAELERRLAEKEARLEELLSSTNDAPDDLAQLESALAERGEHVQRLTGELRESERIGRELLRELGHARGIAAASEPLSAENARLKANLEALTWTVEELEGRLSNAPAAPR